MSPENANLDRTLILGALDDEVEAFREHADVRSISNWRGYTVSEGSIRGHEVVISRSGVGKSLSAMLTQYLTDRYAPSRILFTGVAGALNPALEIGDTLIAESCMQYDMDVTALGFELGEVPYTPYRILSCDPQLVALARTCRPSTGTVRVGRVLTGDRFIVTSKDASDRYLRDELAGDAVEMEGASAGLVATVNEIPFLIMRTISDKADASTSVNFAQFVQQASRTAWELVDHVMEALSNTD